MISFKRYKLAKTHTTCKIKLFQIKIKIAYLNNNKLYKFFINIKTKKIFNLKIYKNFLLYQEMIQIIHI